MYAGGLLYSKTFAADGQIMVADVHQRLRRPQALRERRGRPVAALRAQRLAKHDVVGVRHQLHQVAKGLALKAPVEAGDDAERRLEMRHEAENVDKLRLVEGNDVVAGKVDVFDGRDRRLRGFARVAGVGCGQEDAAADGPVAHRSPMELRGLSAEHAADYELERHNIKQMRVFI